MWVATWMPWELDVGWLPEGAFLAVRTKCRVVTWGWVWRPGREKEIRSVAPTPRWPVSPQEFGCSSTHDGCPGQGLALFFSSSSLLSSPSSPLTPLYLTPSPWMFWGEDQHHPACVGFSRMSGFGAGEKSRCSRELDLWVKWIWFRSRLRSSVPVNKTLNNSGLLLHLSNRGWLSHLSQRVVRMHWVSAHSGGWVGKGQESFIRKPDPQLSQQEINRHHLKQTNREKAA